MSDACHTQVVAIYAATNRSGNMVRVANTRKWAGYEIFVAGSTASIVFSPSNWASNMGVTFDDVLDSTAV